MRWSRLRATYRDAGTRTSSVSATRTVAASFAPRTSGAQRLVAPAEQRGEPRGETEGGDGLCDPQNHGRVIGARARPPEGLLRKSTLT